MNEKIIEIACDVLKISSEEAAKHCKVIPEDNLYYFWNPVRGGLAVLINEAGEKLVATSAISFEKHLDAYRNNKRN